ncbi:hypothetical protein COCSUDRAFT_26709, partial [Coccomyxa subellipsoidea C-169]
MVRNKRWRVSVKVIPSADTPALLQPGRRFGRNLGSTVATSAPRGPRRPASALPSWRIPARNTAQQEEQQDGFADGDGEAAAAYYQPPPSRRRLRKQAAQEDNRRLHQAWDACFDDNVFRNTCFQAGQPARQAALKQQLQAEFLTAARAALPACSPCSQAGRVGSVWEQVETISRLVYVSISGRTEVSPPAFRCGGCSAAFTVDPVSMGCFPATPQRPLVYYSGALMLQTHELSLASPTSMVAWTSALEEVHVRNGCVPYGQLSGLPKNIWRNLPVAVRQWRRMDIATHDLNRLGVQPICS